MMFRSISIDNTPGLGKPMVLGKTMGCDCCSREVEMDEKDLLDYIEELENRLEEAHQIMNERWPQSDLAS